MSDAAPIREPPAEVRPIAISLPLVLLLAALLYVCFFSRLDALGLVGPDEPRYAEVAREMAQSGDWVTPRLYGKPWFEKPILYYWCAALAFRLFGVNEFAARLPSALAAMLCALALAWAAGRAWPRDRLSIASGATLIFISCAGAIGFARAAGPDMLFSALLALAMVSAFAIVWPEKDTANQVAQQRVSHFVLLFFGVFLGGATLAKGPAAIALSGGSTVLWTVAAGRWRGALRLAHPLAIAGFLGTALPWYLLCARRNPAFLRIFLLEHNLERYLTPLFRHEQPFWFYAPALLVALLPWTVLLVAATRDAGQVWRDRRWSNSPGWFFASWAIFPVLFFSLSNSKLPGYILPAIPPLVLLMARSFTRIAQQSKQTAGSLQAGVGFILMAIAAGVRIRLGSIPLEGSLPKAYDWLSAFRSEGGAWSLLVLAFVGGLCIAFLGLRRRVTASFWLTVLLMAGMIEAASWKTLPRVDRYLSARAGARAAQAQPGAAQSARAFRLHRAWQFGLHFYLRRELPEWGPETPRPAWVFTNLVGSEELVRRGLRVSVVDSTSPQALLVIVSDRPAEGAEGHAH